MTEHTDKVIKRRLELRKERQDNQITFIEGRRGQLTTGYRSGRRVIEFDDKRKKSITEYVAQPNQLYRKKNRQMYREITKQTRRKDDA